MKLNERISYGAVAAAVAMACAGGASVAPSVADAATLGGTTLVMSKQSNALATSGATQLVTLSATLGANYLSADRVKLSASPSTLALFPSTGKPADVSCGGATLGASNYNSTDVSYRANGAIAEGTTCTFVVAVRPAAISGSVGISYQAFFGSSADVADSAAARVVATVVDQFASTIKTKLNNTVDVNNSRYHFTSDDGTASGVTNRLTGREDHLIIGLTNTPTPVVTAATVTSVTVTVLGDFSFLDDDGTAGCVSTDINGSFGQASDSDSTGTLSISSDCRSLTWSTSADQANADITIALGKNAAASATAGTNTAGVAVEKVLTAPQEFSASVAFTYYNTARGPSVTGSVTTTANEAGNAGEWDLNGASINVGFMPYTAGTSRILNLTNRSAQTGAVTVSAINEAGVECPAFSVGAIAATSILNISAAVDTGIRACYGSDFAGRVALSLVANIPGTQAELYSGYNRNGSLSTVVNSSNGQ
jgi:S-layer protein Slr4